MNNAFLVGTRQAVSLQDRRRIGSTPAASAVLLLACVAICAASPIAHSAETEITPAPKLSEIKPEIKAKPEAKPELKSPESKSPAPKTPIKKPNEKPAPGHAFDGAASEVETIRPVGTQTAALATLLESLKKGELTPTAAFENKQMTGAQALELLADTTIGTLQYRPLVHDLAAIVATKAPELIADVEKVAPQAKVRLAPYFLEVRDPRAVPFYESILAALPQPPSDKGALPVFKLSDYYAAIGDYTKAAETRLRMKDYTTNPQFLANSEVEAARFYMQIGEKEKAQKLYEGASRHGYGWATGLAIHDQSRALLEQGRHEEARKLLKTPITGQYADQIQTAVNSLLGTSYFQTGEWQESEKYSRLAVEGYKALVNPLQNEGMEVPVNVAEAQLYWSQLWLKQPFVTQPDHLQVNVRQGQSYEQPLLLNLAVRSPKSLAVEVTTDNDGVKPRLEGQPSDKGYFWHQGVVLEVASEKFEKDTTVTVKISSPESNQFVSNVLLQIEVQPAIRLFPDMIFFGEVSASNIAETTLEYASTQ